MSLSNPEKKSFWQKPESVTTALSFLGLGILGFMFLDKILPLVNRVLDFALEAAWKGGLLAGIAVITTWVITSKDLHKVGWILYQSLMRKLTQFVVTTDPIAILKGHVKKLKGNLETITGALGTLRGQARELEKIIRETASQLSKSQGMAAQAHKLAAGGQKGMKTEFMLQARKAGRLEKSGVTYQGLLNRLKAHIAVTEKIYEAANFMVADIEDTVEEETKKRKMIHASHKAMSAAKAVLAANEQRELYDMAMEEVANDYYAKLGEIDQFMEDSQHFINTMDLENGAYEADALTKLEEWEKRSESLLAGGTGNTKFRVDAADHHDFEAEDQEIEEKLNRGSYADLLGKLD